MNRGDFQRLAETRLREAEALLAAVPSYPDGAYYLAGYAVECGLKACIAKLTQAGDFPPPRKTVEACYSHNLVELRSTARLDAEFKQAADANPQLADNWKTVAAWTEQSRYAGPVPEPTARGLLTAITDPVTGVLTWITTRW